LRNSRSKGKISGRAKFPDLRCGLPVWSQAGAAGFGKNKSVFIFYYMNLIVFVAKASSLSFGESRLIALTQLSYARKNERGNGFECM